MKYAKHKSLLLHSYSHDREGRPFDPIQGKILVLGRPTLSFMYLIYLDESGEPSNWQNQKNFVIAGVAVHEFHIYQLKQKLKAVQDKYFPEIDVPIIFHATDIRGGREIFRDLHPKIREELLNDLYQEIFENRFPHFAIFGAVMNISVAKNPFQVRGDTFEEVISSYNNFLRNQYHHDKRNKGLVIIDRNREEQYRRLLDSYQQEGTKYGFLANIADIPYFARCRDTRMLQFADLVAYAMFRYYEKQDDSYLKIILPRIYLTQNGTMFGMKHLTKNRDCECISCNTFNRAQTSILDET